MEIACVIDTGLASPLPDPVAAAERTETMVRSLEGIGAAVESERTGEAFFALDGLRGIHGGDSLGVLAAARRAVGPAPRIAAGPTRFAAHVAAGGWSRPVPIAALESRLGASEREAAEFLAALERLGIETLPRLARLSPDQVADRFGPLGLRALRLARG